MQLSNSATNELPFVLCPNLDPIKVNVILLWFKPKGGGRECPVVLLEKVPVGFDSVLEACNFLKRPEGWLIDVTDKDSNFWRRIFGDIEFTKKQPIKVYEPQKLILAPPPPSVVTVVRAFSDEHISYLTKSEGVTGTDAVRACKSDAIRGAVSCRGAWSVIKAAALDRLGKNPEDVSTFEYIWATGRAQNLNVDNVPESISHELLLQKIIERQRLTAQIELVLPSWFIRTGPTNFIIKADWKNRYLFSTPVFGGPIDSKLFPEVEGLAQHLLDLSCAPFSDDSIIRSIESRIVNECAIENDWVDDLEIGDTGLAELPQEVPDQHIQSPHLTYSEVFNILDRINMGIIRRVDYSKTLSREVFVAIVGQTNINILSSEYLRNLEELLGYFSGVTNKDSLQKAWNLHHEKIHLLLQAIAVSNPARMKLLQLFSSVRILDEFINKNIISIDNDPVNWWWNGYGFSRTPSITGWQIFKVDNYSSIPIGTGLYSSINLASQALYRIVLQSKVRAFKTNIRSTEQFYGFSTRSGSILQLTPMHPIDEQTDIPLPPYKFSIPALWKPNLPVLSRELVMSQIVNLEQCLGFKCGASPSDTIFRVVDVNKELVIVQDDRLVCPVRAGFITYSWAFAVTNFMNRTDLHQDAEEIIQTLIGSPNRSDIEIGIEDDLLIELDALSGEVGARLGRPAVDVLRKAIQAPSEIAEWQCYEYWEISRGENTSVRFDDLLRGILLMAAQYRGYLKLSLAGLERLRLGLESSALIIHAMMAYLWYRLRWANSNSEILQAVGVPGDLPYGELFPNEVIQWQVFCKIEQLIGKVALQLMRENTSRAEVETRAQSRVHSLLQ